MDDNTDTDIDADANPTDVDIPLDQYRVTVLAIVGPPASGVSTVAQLCRDAGVPVRETDNAIREHAQEHYENPDDDQIRQTAQHIRSEHGPAGPTALCLDWIRDRRAHGYEVIGIASCRDQAEIDWLRDRVGPTLVVRIDANPYTRTQRYVDRELDQERSAVPMERIREIREELYDREQHEVPYPDHEVTIRNTDDTSIADLYGRIERLIEVLDV
jgi:dephospho-CoA kinase